ncbi:MAG: PTS transporter subunit IIB, partial [Actinobacteria bacterium]|nr:PTS transporter subunit IIB [Actinomycetota bacterium]
MPIVLHRVDERLIHGQVVIGWGHQLRPDRYVVVDDELAASDWEQDLYRLGAGDADVVFADVESAVER